MINFGILKIEGFGSIENHSEDLSFKGVTILRGRNGVGKTTILSSLTWVLYGKTLKDNITDPSTWSNFRTKSFKGTKVEIYFQINNQVHRVIRCFKYTEEIDNLGKGESRLIYQIDQNLITLKNKKDIQDLIEKNLGMSYKLFKNSVMFGQGVKRLIQDTSTDKKTLFEEIFNIQYINEAREKAKYDMDKLIEVLRPLQNQKEILKNDINSNLSFYHETKRKESEFKENNDKYKVSLEKQLKGIIVPSFNNDKYNHISEKLSKLIDNFQKDKMLNDAISNEISIFTTKAGIESFVNEIISLIKKDPTKAIKNLEKFKEKLVVVNTFFKVKEKFLTRQNRLKTKLFNLNSIRKENTFSLKLREDIINKIKMVDNQKLDIVSDKYLAKVNTLKQQLKIVTRRSNILENKIQNLKWLIDIPLGNKGIKNYIFENSLISLNQILKEFSAILGFQIEFSVDLNSSRKDFYSLIDINGHIADYDELSGGQKQLVNIAMVFAIHRMVTLSKGLNILFLDEVFESLSPDNIEIVTDLIKSTVNSNLWIITHQDNLSINGRIKNISYKDGLSVFE